VNLLARPRVLFGALPTISEEANVDEKCIVIGRQHEHPREGNQKGERMDEFSAGQYYLTNFGAAKGEICANDGPILMAASAVTPLPNCLLPCLYLQTSLLSNTVFAKHTFM
jgi:hypothetical protein